MSEIGGRPENLKSYKPGQSGNKNGRPRKLPDEARLLNEVMSEKQNDLVAAKAILMAARAKAIKGDIRAGKWLWERTYGKVKQVIEIEKESPIDIDKLCPSDAERLLDLLEELQKKTS